MSLCHKISRLSIYREILYSQKNMLGPLARYNGMLNKVSLANESAIVAYLSNLSVSFLRLVTA